jgi:hypothetical protein
MSPCPLPSAMAIDHEAHQSVAGKPVPSSGESDASATDTPFSGATPDSNALPKNDAHPELEKLEKADLLLGTSASACYETN